MFPKVESRENQYLHITILYQNYKKEREKKLANIEEKNYAVERFEHVISGSPNNIEKLYCSLHVLQFACIILVLQFACIIYRQSKS